MNSFDHPQQQHQYYYYYKQDVPISTSPSSQSSSSSLPSLPSSASSPSSSSSFLITATTTTTTTAAKTSKTTSTTTTTTSTIIPNVIDHDLDDDDDDDDACNINGNDGDEDEDVDGILMKRDNMMMMTAYSFLTAASFKPVNDDVKSSSSSSSKTSMMMIDDHNNNNNNNKESSSSVISYGKNRKKSTFKSSSLKSLKSLKNSKRMTILNTQPSYNNDIDNDSRYNNDHYYDICSIYDMFSYDSDVDYDYDYGYNYDYDNNNNNDFNNNYSTNHRTASKHHHHQSDLLLSGGNVGGKNPNEQQQQQQLRQQQIQIINSNNNSNNNNNSKNTDAIEQRRFEQYQHQQYRSSEVSSSSSSSGWNPESEDYSIEQEQQQQTRKIPTISQKQKANAQNSCDSGYSGESSSDHEEEEEQEQDEDEYGENPSPEHERFEQLNSSEKVMYSSVQATYEEHTRRLYQVWNRNCEKSSLLSNYKADISMPGEPKSNVSNGRKTFNNNNKKSSSKSLIITREIICDLQTKFHEIDLYPTESQVYEMIQFCCQLKNSSRPVDNGNKQIEVNQPIKTGITFAEYCFFASILIHSSNYPRQQPLCENRQLLRRFQLHVDNLQNHFVSGQFESESNWDIFLGGSCNPTRWRFDLVMPELKKNSITYYNPQVDHWGPELIELENYAKQNCEILFFVIDNQTRAIASMVEVAYSVAAKRKMICTIIEMGSWSEEMKIGDDHISEQEYEQLFKGRQVLRDIIERQETPVFDQIPKALRAAINILENDIYPHQLAASDDVVPVKNGHISMGDKIIKFFHCYVQSRNPKNNQFTFNELPFAYRMLTGDRRNLPLDLLEQLAFSHLMRNKSRNKSDNVNNPFPILSVPPLEEIIIDFDDFCIIITELDIALATIIDDQNRRIPETCESNESESESIATTAADNNNNNDKANNNNNKKVKNVDVKRNSNDNNNNKQQEEVKNQTEVNIFGKIINTFKSYLQSNTHPTLTSTDIKRMERMGGKILQYNENPKSFETKMKMLPFSSHSNKQPSINDHRKSSFHFSSLSNRHHKSSSSRFPYHRNSVSSIQHKDQLVNYVSPFSRRASVFTQLLQTSTGGVSGISSKEKSITSSQSQTSITSVLYDNAYDLYIGGCFDNKILNETIIPKLKKNSISFRLPKFNKLANYERFIPLEAINIEKCRHLLFFISSESLDISSMIIAAYCVGAGYSVILCIQDISPTKSQVASKLSKVGIKDYNRARSYLSDMATKLYVPVFDNIDEAIDKCIAISHE